MQGKDHNSRTAEVTYTRLRESKHKVTGVPYRLIITSAESPRIRRSLTSPLRDGEDDFIRCWYWLIGRSLSRDSFAFCPGGYTIPAPFLNSGNQGTAEGRAINRIPIYPCHRMRSDNIVQKKKPQWFVLLSFINAKRGWLRRYGCRDFSMSSGSCSCIYAHEYLDKRATGIPWGDMFLSPSHLRGDKWWWVLDGRNLDTERVGVVDEVW